MDEEEKQYQDAQIIGQYNGEVRLFSFRPNAFITAFQIKIVQSMENVHARSVAPSSASQVKILMKRRRSTPKPIGSYSREGVHCENHDVKSATMEGSMNAISTLRTPQYQGDALTHEVAEQTGIEKTRMEMPSATTPVNGSKQLAVAESDELAKRLAALHK